MARITQNRPYICETPTDKKMARPVHFFTQNGASIVCALKPDNTAAVDAVRTNTRGSFAYSYLKLEPCPILY